MDLETSKQKVLNTPELVERLLLSMNPTSILQLTKSRVVEKKILQKGLSLKVWRGLVKQFGDEVKELTEILKLMNPKDPESLLLPLLHMICEKYPLRTSWREEVRIGCRCQAESHMISLDAFQFLEEHVEGVLGTAAQSLLALGILVLNEQENWI